MQGLPQELRRSAAEELAGLTAAPHLLAAMEQQQQLEALWALCVPAWSEEGDAAAAPPGTAVGAGAPSGSIFDMQLPVACLQLLAALIARSPEALAWITGAPDRWAARACGV